MIEALITVGVMALIGITFAAIHNATGILDFFKEFTAGIALILILLLVGGIMMTPDFLVSYFLGGSDSS